MSQWPMAIEIEALVRRMEQTSDEGQVRSLMGRSLDYLGDDGVTGGSDLDIVQQLISPEAFVTISGSTKHGWNVTIKYEDRPSRSSFAKLLPLAMNACLLKLLLAKIEEDA